MSADRRASALYERGKRVGIALRNKLERLVVGSCDLAANILAAAFAEGSVGKVVAVVREVGRDDKQSLRVHQSRQRTGAHPHLVLAKGTHHERDNRKAAAKRKLKERILDLRGMLGGMYAVVACNRRNERKPVDPVAVDLNFAERRRDGGRVRSDETVLDPCAVARREKDDALVLRALDEADRPPRRLAGVRPARVRKDEDVRRLARRIRRDAALPPVGHRADPLRRSRIPGSRYRAFK